MIEIKLSSIFVSSQTKALDFYTNTLGFVKKNDVPAGEHRWLTVGIESSEFEMLLEPNVHSAAKTYQESIFKEGIAATMLFVDDLDFEYNRLKELEVKFKTGPIDIGNVRLAVFDDSCGNWIQICQLK